MNETSASSHPRLPVVADAEIPEIPEIPEITVYWRPGCGYCGSLLRQLAHHDIAHRLVNIWDDQSGAATVRSIARGNETVPTVMVGNVGLVNPSVQQVVQAIQAVRAQGTQAEPVG